MATQEFPDQKEMWATLFLNSLNHIGPILFRSLMEKYGSAKESVDQGPEHWNVGYSRSDLQWDEAKKTTEQDMEAFLRGQVRIKTWKAQDYPSLLKEIPDPPPVLYMKGKDIDWNNSAVALVGTRSPTYYGERVARALSEELADMGLVTVSGLAKGIDSMVHRATLGRGGETWAVLGCGLNTIYPSENKSLAEWIEKEGALISEFSLNTKPHPAFFPKRNRIISGLSLGVVVVEGAQKSGSLITARLAADQGREVFAVPGPIYSPLSFAPHYLIRSGAKLVEGAVDIVEELGLQIKADENENKQAVQIESKDKDLQQILSYLKSTPVQKEVLAIKLGKPIAELSALILNLELKGLIKTLPGGFLVSTQY